MTILRLPSYPGEGSVGWNWDRLKGLGQGHLEEDEAEGEFAQHASQRLCCGEGAKSGTHLASHHPPGRGCWRQKSRWSYQGIVHGLGSRGFKDRAAGKPLSKFMREQREQEEVEKTGRRRTRTMETEARAQETCWSLTLEGVEGPGES